MDVTKLLESEFLGVQYVKDSPSKKGVILSQGALADSKDGQYQNLQVLIEIDGKKKNWKMNKTSLRNLSKSWGTYSEAWVGKTVGFSIGLLQGGREGIVGNPL